MFIPRSWSSWFFLRPKQLFLCFQDSIHLATKLRNRLLSDKVSLIMGSYNISSQHLQDLIENHSKFDHNLVSSDIYVKDRQNYASCLKISSENVLSMLDENEKASATHCYLTMLHYVTLAYIDKTTNILERLFYAWSIVFICRYWWIWLRYKIMLDIEPKAHQNRKPIIKTLQPYFITFPAFISIEINAHVLTYMLLLVLNKKLPPESLKIFLFSSQSCENTFRSARALTGPLSSITNFTMKQFLAKTRKISILNEIKTFEQSNDKPDTIKFPKHHKQNDDSSSSSILSSLQGISIHEIEKKIYDAYENAKTFIEKLDMPSLCKKHNVFKLNDLSTSVRDDLENLIYITDNATLDVDDVVDEDSDDSDEESTPLPASDMNDESEQGDEGGDDEEMEDECTTSTKDGFYGMRIYSSVADKNKDKFFEVNIDGKVKYIHKQTAVWYLTTKNNRLSSDRLLRVQKMNKQE